MARIVTHAEVVQVPDGGELRIEPSALLTPLAQERVSARRIRIVQTEGVAAEDTVQVAARVAEHVLLRLGTNDSRVVQRVAAEVIAALGTQVGQTPELSPAGSPQPVGDGCRARRKVVITSTGRNQKGVVARLTSLLADLGVDILDISQTLVGDFFTMLLIVDIAEMRVDFGQLKQSLEQVADALGIHVLLMHEDLVRSLHRV